METDWEVNVFWIHSEVLVGWKWLVAARGFHLCWHAVSSLQRLILMERKIKTKAGPETFSHVWTLIPPCSAFSQNRLWRILLCFSFYTRLFGVNALDWRSALSSHRPKQQLVLIWNAVSALVSTYLLTFIRQKRTRGYSLSPKEVLLLSFPDSSAEQGKKSI